jgi:hypothetical protein
MTAVSSFFSEFLGTAILAFVIMAATDKGNAAPPLGLLPLVIFLTLLGLSLAFGMQTCECFGSGCATPHWKFEKKSIFVQSCPGLWAAPLSDDGWIRQSLLI